MSVHIKYDILTFVKQRLILKNEKNEREREI